MLAQDAAEWQALESKSPAVWAAAAGRPELGELLQAQKRVTAKHPIPAVARPTMFAMPLVQMRSQVEARVAEPWLPSSAWQRASSAIPA